MIKFKCLEDRVLIRPIKKTELLKTSGGIIDPNVKTKAVSEGEVVAIGEGFTARDTGLFVPTILVVGDKVLYGSGAGVLVDIETKNGVEELLIMREGDVFLGEDKKD